MERQRDVTLSNQSDQRIVCLVEVHEGGGLCVPVEAPGGEHTSTPLCLNHCAAETHWGG